MSSKALAARDALITLLEAVQLDGEPAFAGVQGHPYGQFDKLPVVRVLPGSQDTEKSSFSQNDRIVAFTVITSVEQTQDSDGTEFDYLYKLTDLIIDTLDAADYADTLSGTLGTYILNATHGEWYTEDNSAGPMLSAEINVEVKYSKNN